MKQEKSRLSLANVLCNLDYMIRTFDQIKSFAKMRYPVLLTGERGVGKEVFAQKLHDDSGRRGKFLSLNCAGLSEYLLESELFGHKKGAFSGAISNHQGIFAAADSGTAFLDEIGEMPLLIQARLLRSIGSKRFVKIREVGGTAEKECDVRLIFATNKNLSTEVSSERFRADLFDRIAVLCIDIPPLRSCTENDLSELTDWYVNKENQNFGDDKTLTNGARRILKQYDWPGNIRELSTVIIRLFAQVGDKREIDEVAVNAAINAVPKKSTSNIASCDSILSRPLGDNFRLNQLIDEVEVQYLKRALREASGTQKNAAKLLGISYQTFRSKLALHRISTRN